MADVRTLLAAERQARRIQHPYLTYTKSGQLVCNVCNLNIKSETLWPGHLKSVNHRKNVQAAEDRRTKNLKRKLDDVEEGSDEDLEGEREGNKKSKSRVVSTAEEDTVIEEQPPTLEDQNGTRDHEVETRTEEVASAAEPETATELASGEEVDEDELAAFEREIASLDQHESTSGTITAAPMTAEQLAQQTDEDRQRKEDLDVDAEKEEEERRAEEEIEVMEDLGERVRKLKEKREALRHGGSAAVDTGQVTTSESFPNNAKDEEEEEHAEDAATESDDSDVDDWYS